MSFPTSKTPSLFNRIGVASVACSFSMFTGLATAGPLDIATNALEIATGVEPNVMVLNDDSGSMNWSIMISGTNQGRYFIDGPGDTDSYLYVQDDPENSANSVLASQQALDRQVTDAGAVDWTALGYPVAQWQGVWRVRNHNFNTIYYNPEIQYKPWAGVDDSGTPFGNANPAAARTDPYQTGRTTFNLTVNNVFNSRMPRGGTDHFVPENLYPSHYYTWTDTDGDGAVDFDDAHSLIEIRTAGACSVGATCPATFARTGVREDCGGDGMATSTTVCTAAQELQNFANFYSYYRRRELTTKAAITTVLDQETSIRVGMATINNVSNNRIQVESMNLDASSGNKRDLFDAIYETQSSGGTPLRQNLERVGQYFACGSGNIFGTAASTPGNNNCPVESSPAGECQQNYAILMTDGFYNGNNPNVNNADGDGAGGTAQGPFDGASFGDNRTNTLADVAMHYYERDLHSTLADDVPTTTRDRNRYNGNVVSFETMHQHMATYTVGLGVAGTLGSNPTDVSVGPPNFVNPVATGWPTPVNNNATTIDDLRHAAWNGRGDFLSAADPSALTDSLSDIFSEIQAGTGAASSVAFNTQNLESGALVFRAFFDTNLNTGSLIAQDVDLLGNISPTIRWDAATELDGRAGVATDNRDIITFDPDTSLGIPFRWASLNATQQNDLNLPAATGGDIATAPDPLGEKRLNYLRGQTENEGSSLLLGEFRTRETVAGKLGDIVHSAPVFVGAPPFQFRDNVPYPDTAGELYSEFASASGSREEIVYIGANDGMLHGFSALDGSEKFAYVPNILFPELSKLTDPDYVHQYYVDLSPAINDVYIQPATGTNAGDQSWNTVIVGGLGTGAPGYFALNVTDPTDFTNESTAASNVLWEFTQADDVGATVTNNDLNLGVPISRPLMALSNIVDGSGMNRWVVIFGNGYNSASVDGDAELYVAFLDGGIDGTWTRGVDFFKLSTGVGKAESADTTTPNSLGGVRGIDIDQNGTVDIVYAGDYQGNVYRFNLTGTTVADTIATGNNPVQKLFTATYDSAAGPVQPITNRPVVIKHPTEDGFIVILGTGSYFTNSDITTPGSQTLQSIYGLWDDFTAGDDSINEVDYARLQEQTLANASTVEGFTTRTLTNIIFNWGHTGGSRKEGWVINLDVVDGGGVEFPGERAVRNFLVRGGIGFVNSVIPRSTLACTTGPGGFEYAFNPETGGSGIVPVFDLNNDGNFDSDDNVDGVDSADNIVSGTRFDKSTPTDSSFIGNRKVTQTSDQGIRSVGTNTGADSASGRHSWREIEVDL